MANYLFAVQTAGGRELVALYLEPKKVSDVTATVSKDGVLELRQKGSGALFTTSEVPPGDLSLCRWDADDKLAQPVMHSIKRLDASTE